MLQKERLTLKKKINTKLNGEIITLNGRTGRAYRSVNENLITIWVNGKGFRSIYPEHIIKINCNGLLVEFSH